MRKLLTLIVVLGVVGYFAWLYLVTEKQAKARGGPAALVAVETAKVKAANLSDRAVFTGSVRARERFDAAAKISETIKEILVDAGDSVAVGDALAVLDDEEYVLAVAQAEASLAVAKANADDAASQLEITRRDLDRAEKLRSETVISAQEYDRYAAANQAQQAKYEVTLAQVKLSEATLSAARVRLGHTRVTAEWTGGSGRRIVSKRHVDAGAIAKANDPILTIIDIATVKAMVTVSEKEYPRITVGYPVAVSTDAFPGRTFFGKVRRISQEFGDLAREAEVEVEVDNPDLALKPGMFIRAAVEFGQRDSAPAAPLEAVVRREDGDRGVFVVDRESSQVTFRSVTEGILDKGWVELVGGAGLLGCDVVVMGQHLLKDGAKVVVASES